MEDTTATLDPLLQMHGFVEMLEIGFASSGGDYLSG